MLRRILQYFGIREKKRFGLSQDVLDRVDMSYDEDFPAFHYERMMVERGDVVGKTATIDKDEIKATTEQFFTPSKSFEASLTIGPNRLRLTRKISRGQVAAQVYF